VLLHKAGNDPALNTAMERTGILDAADRRVKTYSHGMRQRLGLALALCGDRDVLILDEPANGLDPLGVRDVRSLLREAANRGTAVFISSHQLSEVERACDRAAILVGGRVVETGTISELGGDEGAIQVQVNAEQRERALAVLAAHDPRLEGDGTITLSGISGHEVSRLLGEGGVYANSISQLRSSLEERFLRVTEESVDASTRR
jgi:ABC-2 type transport system ATP-binding protein